MQSCNVFLLSKAMMLTVNVRGMLADLGSVWGQLISSCTSKVLLKRFLLYYLYLLVYYLYYLYLLLCFAGVDI